MHQLVAFAVLQLHEFAFADADAVFTRAGTAEPDRFFHNQVVNFFKDRHRHRQTQIHATGARRKLPTDAQHQKFDRSQRIDEPGKNLFIMSAVGCQWSIVVTAENKIIDYSSPPAVIGRCY